MNILFLADPNSIHDVKWMSWMADKHNCFLIVRRHHLEGWTNNKKEEFYKKYQIRILFAIDDFSILRFWKTILQWYKIKGILIKFQIDIFHVIFAEPNALWAIFNNKVRNWKWVLTTRGTDVLKTIPGHYERNDLLNKTISSLYNNALTNFDLITCTSFLQSQQVNRLSIPKRVEIIRTGVDVSLVCKHQKFSLPVELGEHPFILFPRNMQPLYNHEFSLSAIKQLPEDILNSYKFVFLDRDSKNQEYVKRIEQIMLNIGVEHFVFLPHQSQDMIHLLYKHTTIVVMNPISDGAPVSAMEALLFGRPLILGNLQYDDDIFGDVCYKLNDWDPAKLANLIAQLINEPPLQQTESRKERIFQKANRDIEMSRLQQLYLQ